MHPHATFLARFWAKVDVRGPDDCWLWKAGVSADGYGRVAWNRQSQNAHRVAYFLANGAWPKTGRHSCDNPPCCNPAHILDGTQTDNVRDRVERGRSRGGSQPGESHHGAKLTAADVVAIRAVPSAWGVNTSLAKRYGVTQATISLIRARRTWRHVP